MCLCNITDRYIPCNYRPASTPSGAAPPTGRGWAKPVRRELASEDTETSARDGDSLTSLWRMSFRPGAIRGAVSGTPGEIDYRLARRSLISEFKKGRLAQHEVCDAHPELRRAAQECSEATSMVCPICEDDHVVLVSYVFGPRLPAHGRCITSKAELRKLAKRSGEFACYVVEVCPSCSWNHLARTFLLNPARSA